jgi:hypothetical protein
MSVLRTYVYIDGFNFYYGQVKGTAYKWLNFESLVRNYLDLLILVNHLVR